MSLDAEQDRRHRLYCRDRLLRLLCNGTPKCQCCGNETNEFLAFHHKIPVGKSQYRELGGGCYMAMRIFSNGSWKTRSHREERMKKAKEELEVLCHNCHYAITWFGYCPHRIEVSQ